MQNKDTIGPMKAIGLALNTVGTVAKVADTAVRTGGDAINTGLSSINTTLSKGNEALEIVLDDAVDDLRKSSEVDRIIRDADYEVQIAEAKAEAAKRMKAIVATEDAPQSNVKASKTNDLSSDDS